MAKVQALQNTLQASFQPQWWQRASVGNVVVLCQTILVSRYRYRNFFKRAYVSLQERPHYFGIECDALESVELKKCVSLWGELVSVGEWVFTAERCVMLRSIHFVTQLVTLLTLGIVTVGSQHVTCNTWHPGRDDTFTYPDNAHSQHEMTWHQEIQSYIYTFLQEKKFVSIVIHIVHYIIARLFNFSVYT